MFSVLPETHGSGLRGGSALGRRLPRHGERPLSVIYFELKDVNLYHPADWDKIYAFFAEKMPLLEQAYWEYRDLINERIKNS